MTKFKREIFQELFITFHKQEKWSIISSGFEKSITSSIHWRKQHTLQWGKEREIKTKPQSMTETLESSITSKWYQHPWPKRVAIRVQNYNK